MFKRILVSTDGSEHSRRALAAAVEIAAKFQAELELIHVVVPPPPLYADLIIGSSFLFSDEEVNTIGRKVMDVTLAGIETEQVPIRKKIIQGAPGATIINELKRDFDLIVIGSHGFGPITGTIVGSVTQKVLAGSPCPVLVVK